LASMPQAPKAGGTLAIKYIFNIFIEVPCIFVYIYCIWKNQLMHIDLLKVNKLKYN
jgi:hypothetical protein